MKVDKPGHPSKNGLYPYVDLRVDEHPEGWRILLHMRSVQGRPCTRESPVLEHGSSMMQVMGEMHSAMQSIADFNRIVWDEVNQTCKEEADRISRSFHLRNNTRKGITDVQVGMRKALQANMGY